MFARTVQRGERVSPASLSPCVFILSPAPPAPPSLSLLRLCMWMSLSGLNISPAASRSRALLLACGGGATAAAFTSIVHCAADGERPTDWGGESLPRSPFHSLRGEPVDKRAIGRPGRFSLVLEYPSAQMTVVAQQVSSNVLPQALSARHTLHTRHAAHTRSPMLCGTAKRSLSPRRLLQPRMQQRLAWLCGRVQTSPF